MKFNVTWIEKKSPDWYVAQLKDVEAPNLVYADVSINRVNKKNEVFPNFDNIMNGGVVEGEPWQSSAGKWYLFAPKPVAPQGGATRGSEAINKAMERKEQGISKTMDRKEEGIMTSSTIRMAVDIALAEVVGQPFDAGVFKGRINFWREWLVTNWPIEEK